MTIFAAFLFVISLLPSTLASSHKRPEVFHIQAEPEKVPSSVEFTYTGTSLDGPKVKPVNTTTFDWWYFDAVSVDLAKGDLSSIVINFYDATPGGFEALTNTTTKLETSLTGTFRNGSMFSVAGYPAAAVVLTEGDSSAGRWGEYSYWEGSWDLKRWKIAFEYEALGIKGSMLLESVRIVVTRNSTSG